MSEFSHVSHKTWTHSSWASAMTATEYSEPAIINKSGVQQDFYIQYANREGGRIESRCASDFIRGVNASGHRSTVRIGFGGRCPVRFIGVAPTSKQVKDVSEIDEAHRLYTHARAHRDLRHVIVNEEGKLVAE